MRAVSPACAAVAIGQLPARGIGAMSAYVLHIFDDNKNFKLIWEVIEADGSPSSPAVYSVNGNDLMQAAKIVRAQLQTISLKPDPFEAAEFAPLLNALADFGNDLFVNLMPNPAEDAEFRKRFDDAAESTNNQRHGLKIVLHTSDLFVPWGFVCPKGREHLPSEPSVSLADMKGFWLSQFSISVVYDKDPPLPQRRKAQFCSVLALHNDMVGMAEEFLSKNCKECVSRLDELRRGPQPSAVDWDEFETVWEKVRYDQDSVLYLYGHSDGESIYLKDTNSRGYDASKHLLPASSFKRKFPSKDKDSGKDKDSASIFILNGCRTTAGGTYQPAPASFLKGTRDRGYYGFIGTEAEVSNVFACRYGTEFLWRLCKERRSVGEAFDELLENNNFFPWNLLYSCYADRKFRFAPASPAEQR
jgi:hypothetical protein